MSTVLMSVCEACFAQSLVFERRARVSVISRAMKRTVGALRQQALKLGIGLGHRR
jgi:hypothetical protein